MEFGKIDHPFPISKRRNYPLSFFVVPAGVVDDVLELVRTHEYVHDGCELFYLFLLISNRI